MKCPNCGLDASAGAEECAGCGVIYAKFKAKKERVELAAKAGLAPEEGGQVVPRFDPRTARLVAGGVVALWIVAFGLYCRHAVGVAREKAAREASER